MPTGQYCYWAAAQIQRRDGRSAEAARTLARAERAMQTSADALEPEDRERYLAIPWHADLRRAIAAGVWPDPPR